MNKNEYLKQRAELMQKSKGLLDAGNVEEANQAMAEVEQLDNDFTASATAQANLNALSNAQTTAMNAVSVEPANPIQVATTTAAATTQKETPNYASVWAKSLLGNTLNQNEQAVFDAANERLNADFSHSTTNTPTLIPDTVVAGIWKIAEEDYPLLADARKFAITGTLTINKHDGIVTGDAQWVDESETATDEENKFGQLVLSGFELNKVATITWKMKSMSEKDFIDFIQKEIAERVGAALGVAVVRGTGVKQPKGVVTELLAEDGTPQVVEYADQIKYADTTKAMSKIHSSFVGKAAIYANNTTIWTQLANIVDGNGRPYFVPDTTAGGVGYLFGKVVKPEAGLNDGQVLIGDAQDTLVVNTNQAMTVAMEDHVKGRKTDYGAYAIMDAGLLSTKGFALLQASSPKA